MTDSIEFVSPVIKDGIELYISADGNKSGMSQSGLSVFCGVGVRSIFGEGCLGDKLAQVEPGGKPVPEILKPFQGKVFHPNLVGGNGAKIITAECCAVFVEYYAFDSKAANETAKFSYRRFASKGILQWIREETGTVTNIQSSSMEAMLQQIIRQTQQTQLEIFGMKQQLDALNKVNDAYPVVNILNQQINNNIVFLPAGFKEPFTLREWVRHYKGIELTDDELASFQKAVDEQMALQQDSPERQTALDELARQAQNLEMGYN